MRTPRSLIQPPPLPAPARPTAVSHRSRTQFSPHPPPMPVRSRRSTPQIPPASFANETVSVHRSSAPADPLKGYESASPTPAA